MEKKEAMKILKDFHDKSALFSVRTALDTLIPELKESEDERIRKELTEFLKSASGGLLDSTISCRTFGKWLSWFEMQGQVKESVISQHENKTCKENSNSLTGEDERIRKWLITQLELKSDVNNPHDLELMILKSIAWLKKQGEQKPKFRVGDTIKCKYDDRQFTIKSVDLDKGTYNYTQEGCGNDIDYADEEFEIVEQKPADKNEPKFKIGNWYQCTKDFFGKGVTFDKNTAYYCAKEGCLQNEYGCHIAIVKDLYDNFKLWTIADAMDGDVLACGDKVNDCPFIFHNLTEALNPRSYCGINTLGNFQDNDENGGHWCYSNIVRPATKEQRDLLFKKMKDAGYEFDFDKKKLNEIGNEIEIPFGANDSELQKTTYHILEGFHTEIDGDFVVIKNGEHTATWSEEDEIGLIDALWAIQQARSISKDENDIGNLLYAENWLKSIRQRIGG